MVLPEHEANRLLSEAGISVISLAKVDSAEHASATASELGYPVAMKLSSAKYTHKSEIGGVLLNLRTGSDVKKAYGQMGALREKLDPDAQIIMEPMCPEGAELFIGYQLHAQFGPVISIGLGGTFLELTEDVAFRLLPARTVDFREMLGELHSWPKLKKGFRGLPPANEDHILLMLERLSAFVLARPDVSEIDLNPVVIATDGALAVDARIVS